MTEAPPLMILPRHNASWFLLRGLLAILFGIVALVVPGMTLFTLAMIFAAFTLADGIFALISGIRGASHHTERWGALVFNGIVGILVGVLFFIWPLMSTFVYAFLLVAAVAAWALITGILQIVAAVRLRREIEGEWLLGLAGALSVVLALWLAAMLILYPAATLLSVGWLIGLYAIAFGAMLVILYFRLRHRRAR